LAKAEVAMLEKREVTRETVAALIDLKVREDQPGLVADNVMTLAEAPYETGARVWGLWDADVPVGLMAMVHPDEFRWHDTGDDTEAAYLWRLMVDQHHQGKGYGRAAIGLALQVTRDWGKPRLVSAVSNVAHSSLGFYQRLGFRTTGRIVEGEVEIVRPAG
jgi:diamine N-acetyltransferase